MIDPNEVTFSIDDFDYEGDRIEEALYLHFGDTRLSFKRDVNVLRVLRAQLDKIIKEIGTLDDF